MTSWNSNVSYSIKNQRIASIAGGLDGNMYPSYGNFRIAPVTFDNRLGRHNYASYMDVSKTDDTQSNWNDFGRKLSWCSQSNNPESYSKSERFFQLGYPTQFQSTIKESINKMKACSISRLNEVDIDRNEVPSKRNIDRDVYNDATLLLRPQKISSNADIVRPSHKIFKCNSTTERDREKTTSISINSNDDVIDKKSDIYDHNQYTTVNNDNCQFSNPNIYKTSTPNYTYNDYFKSRTTNIPTAVTDKSSAKPYPCISQRKIYRLQHHPSKQNDDSNNEMKSIYKVESIPSTYDATSKHVTTNFDKARPVANIMDYVSSTTSIGKSNQKQFERYPKSYDIDQSNGTSTEMHGFYKKNNNSMRKGKTVRNFPEDFKKLHSAFLEQKKEIKRLKLELEEKNSYILQLESEIKSYEPWR